MEKVTSSENTPAQAGGSAKVLIDGDIVCYRCAAATENDDPGIACWQTDEMLKRIISEVEAESHQIYLSGQNNFRYVLYPDYKANRRDKPKPKHLEVLREHLVTVWDADVVDGYEADDALGMNQTQDTIIASIDKDLLQIPGKHYNFVNRELMDISVLEGWRNFYTQLLIGDTSDNIKGCPGVGKAKAPRFLQECDSPESMYETCVKQYTMAKVPMEQMELSAQLLYVWRVLDDKWTPPTQQKQQQ